jgi:C_GCAxxG_C_C family probable redox protein
MKKTLRREKVDGKAMAAAADHYFMVDELCCGESVLKSGCEALGIKSDAVPQIALGFGGGLGLQGHTCGCVNAGVLVLAMALAKEIKDYPTRKMATFGAVGRFCKTIEKRWGSVQCRQLIGLDLTTEAGLNQLLDKVKAEKCAGFVKDTMRVLAEELRSIPKQGD